MNVNVKNENGHKHEQGRAYKHEDEDENENVNNKDQLHEAMSDPFRGRRQRPQAWESADPGGHRRAGTSRGGARRTVLS